MWLPLTSLLPRLIKSLEEESGAELAVFDGIDHVGRIDLFIFDACHRGTVVWLASAWPTDFPQHNRLAIGNVSYGVVIPVLGILLALLQQELRIDGYTVKIRQSAFDSRVIRFP